jgi:hypothetical protein
MEWAVCTVIWPAPDPYQAAVRESGDRRLNRMLKIAANISLLFRELPVLERFHAAGVAGFDGVEMQFPRSRRGIWRVRRRRRVRR